LFLVLRENFRDIKWFPAKTHKKSRGAARTLRDIAPPDMGWELVQGEIRKKLTERTLGNTVSASASRQSMLPTVTGGCGKGLGTCRRGLVTGERERDKKCRPGGKRRGISDVALTPFFSPSPFFALSLNKRIAAAHFSPVIM